MLQTHLITYLSLLLPLTAAAQNATWPTHQYKTSNATPPVLSISHSNNNSGLLGPGYLFFAPDGTPALNPNAAPYIMDPRDGELVWAGVDGHAFNFGVLEWKGERVLVGWNGTVFREPVGRGNGVVHIWDKHYELLATVSLPGNFAELEPGVEYPSNIDLHEIYITPNDTIVVTANNVTQTDLSSVGGPTEGWVTEAQFYEIEISTNEILFEWKSLEHLDQIPLSASLYPLGSEGYDGSNQSLAWGYFHPNAVEPYPGGGFLLSARYLCSAVAIGRDGEVMWRLQGREGNGFELGEGVGFCYQHDIRVVDYECDGSGEVRKLAIRMHDNHNCPIENGLVPTKGKILDVDLATKEVELRQEFHNKTGPIYSNAQGNVQLLPNQNHFIGHGWVPVFEEYSPEGEILQTIQFGNTPLVAGGGFESSNTTAVTLSYRAFKQEWVGCPRTKPDVVAEATRVWVSWNGATEVEAWEVWGGSGNATLGCIKTVRREGFETEVVIPSVQVVQVKAVMKSSACGEEGVSEVVKVT